jgi:hypothetical protein
MLAVGEPSASKKPLLSRNGFRLGAKLMFLSVFLSAPALILSIILDSPAPLILPLLLFLAGLARATYNLLFDEYDYRETSSLSELLAKRRSVLTPNTSNPISFKDSRPIDTAEMVRPASVTEHTTKLLDG